ncbi:MAG: hypothetical protein FWE65_01360 [Eggerthellaceae bacterium]|nr:hypothetical protein [Eggerthellaceae bacterium]
MLAKLLKYEFKASARIFLLIYAALLVLAAINTGLLAVGDLLGIDAGSAFGSAVYSTVMAFTTLLYTFMTVGVFVVTAVIIVMRFYRMLGDEGYLWFTLPITPNQHILGKLIPAFVWSLASALAVMLSALILTFSAGWGESFNLFAEGWNYLVSLGFNPMSWIVWGSVLILVATISSILMCYAAIAIGPNVIKSRLGGSVLVYLIISIVEQMLSTVAMVALAIPMNSKMPALIEAFDDLAIYLGSESMEFTMNLAGASAAIDWIVMWFAIVYSVLYIIITVALYLITRHFLNRKLNLA